MKFKEIASRLTGIGTPVFGVSWVPQEAEVTVARRVITFQEDRRLLYNPGEMEMPERCATLLGAVGLPMTTHIRGLGIECYGSNHPRRH